MTIFFSENIKIYILLDYFHISISPNPSPSPKITLQTISNGTDCASNGVITVLIDHNKTASMSTVLQPKRLAVLAPIILKNKIH